MGNYELTSAGLQGRGDQERGNGATTLRSRRGWRYGRVLLASSSVAVEVAEETVHALQAKIGELAVPTIVVAKARALDR